jgi:hypothetical protein
MQRSSAPELDLTKARRQAVAIARAEALLRADAAWRQTYSEMFARVFDQELTRLLAEQETDAAA